MLLLCRILLLLAFSACTPSADQVQIDQPTAQKGEALIEQFGRPTDCPTRYRLTLDEQSANYWVTKSDFIGGMMGWPLPIGSTVNSYLKEAQQGRTGHEIALHFYTREFFYQKYPGGFFQQGFVEVVSYEAIFEGPQPIGHITLEESHIKEPPWVWVEMTNGGGPSNENSFAFQTVANALEDTTAKLLVEVDKRMCPG